MNGTDLSVVALGKVDNASCSVLAVTGAPAIRGDVTGVHEAVSVRDSDVATTTATGTGRLAAIRVDLT